MATGPQSGAHAESMGRHAHANWSLQEMTRSEISRRSPPLGELIRLARATFTPCPITRAASTAHCRGRQARAQGCVLPANGPAASRPDYSDKTPRSLDRHRQQGSSFHAWRTRRYAHLPLRPGGARSGRPNATGVDGAPIRVTQCGQDVADCFKFRNKVAWMWRSRRYGRRGAVGARRWDELWQCARVDTRP